MFVYIYTYLCTYVDTIQWYIFIDALLALIFAAGHTRTKHWWLSDYRPLPLLGDAEWDGQGWFFDQELGLITWVACLKKHPEHLKRGIPSEFDAYLWTQNSFHSSSYHCCFYPFFVYWMDANITGRQLRWELVSHCWLPSLCCWLPPAIGGLPHWVSSVAWKHWKTKTDSKGLHTPKMTACHRMSPKKGTISKRDYCTSSNPWFFTGIFVRFGGERPCPETKSWNEQLLQLGSFWAWKGVGRRVCRWPDDFLEGKVSPAPKLQGWNERFWHW